MIQGIKAVLLDVDNTILDFHVCAKEAMRVTFAKWKLPFAEEMFSVFTVQNDILWEKIERNELTREELYKIRWKGIFEALGIVGIDPVAFDVDFRKNIEESAEPVEGAHALVEYLSSKYILCISSNAAHKRQMKRLTKAGMLPYVRYLFSSEKIGHSKPEKAFFDACLNTLGEISPTEVVIIGDSLTADIAGGVGSGMKTIWFNYNHIPVPTGIAADYVVNALSEIQNIL